MADRDALDDLIVLLPGTMGSVLSRGGVTLWEATRGTLLRTILGGGESLRSLRLDGDDPMSDVAPDGVAATGLIDDLVFVPGLWKIDGYTRLPVAIAEAFDVVECRLDDDSAGNFLRYPYDWRRDVRFTAAKLGRDLKRKLSLWRSESRNPGARLILVGHSMGGLIAQYFLEVLGGWRDARALITFGTPYRGSPQALQYLVLGYRLIRMDFTETVRTFPSSYQLLPRYKMIATGSGLSRVAELAGSLGLDAAKVAAHTGLHAELDAAWERNRVDPDYLRVGYPTVPIVGTQQTTLLSARWDGQSLTTSSTPPIGQDARLSAGDGTLPRVAALPLSQSSPKDFRGVFVSEQHATLQNQAHIISDLLDRIRMLQAPNLESTRGSPFSYRLPSALDLVVDDAFGAGEAVVVRVRVPGLGGGKPPLLAAEIGTDGGGETQTIPLEPTDEGGLAIIEGLPSGIYRIRVAGFGPDTSTFLPVHSLFAVDGESPA